MSIMRIMVTGWTGFVGKNLVKAFTDKNKYELILPSCQLDITNYNDLRDYIVWNHPDIIIHLAAKCGGIGANQKNASIFWGDNLQMGMNILDVSTKINSILILLGSVCGYPIKPKTIPFIEEEYFDGFPEETNAPYGIAKRTLLVGAKAYAKDKGLRFVYFIPSNMFGIDDHFDLENSHVIPAMIRKFHEAKLKGDKEVILWGDGTPTRDFLYVEDCVKAIKMAVDKEFVSTLPINLGSGNEWRMDDLAENIANIIQYKGKIIWDSRKPNGQPRRVLNTIKANDLLGWYSKTNLLDGLKKTYEWYLRQKFEGSGERSLT